MSYFVDPRVCQITGRPIINAGHDCCGLHHYRPHSPLGLLAKRTEQMNFNHYRYRMMGKENALFERSARDFLKPCGYAAQFLRANAQDSERCTLMVSRRGQSRRQTLLETLRSIFGRATSRLLRHA